MSAAADTLPAPAPDLELLEAVGSDLDDLSGNLRNTASALDQVTIALRRALASAPRAPEPTTSIELLGRRIAALVLVVGEKDRLIAERDRRIADLESALAMSTKALERHNAAGPATPVRHLVDGSEAAVSVRHLLEGGGQ